MIVWGPWSLAGQGMIWEIVEPDITAVQRAGYFGLYRRFDPTRFDPDRWARLVRQAGGQYVVLTAKHHDGFSNWDTATTDFRITSPSSPFSRRSQPDLTRDLIEAFRQQEGVAIGLYYSHFDWDHPDGVWQKRHWSRVKNLARKAPDRWRRFVRFEENQVRELLSRYGPIDVLWFDGNWRKSGAEQDIKPLLEMARRLQPGVVMNDRGTLAFADFKTFEQQIPQNPQDGPWETSMTISQGRGYWYKGETARYRSTVELLRALVEVTSKGGNFLLSVGPRPDGTLPRQETERLQSIGKWLKTNGEAIYGTRPRSGTAKYDWGYITRKGKRIYAIVFDWPTEERSSLAMETEAGQVQRAFLLASKTPIRFRIDGPSHLRLLLPNKPPGPYPLVVVVEQGAGVPSRK